MEAEINKIVPLKGRLPLLQQMGKDLDLKFKDKALTDQKSECEEPTHDMISALLQ